jgi:hypothetical protein
MIGISGQNAIVYCRHRPDPADFVWLMSTRTCFGGEDEQWFGYLPVDSGRLSMTCEMLLHCEISTAEDRRSKI